MQIYLLLSQKKMDVNHTFTFILTANLKVLTRSGKPQYTQHRIYIYIWYLLSEKYNDFSKRVSFVQYKLYYSYVKNYLCECIESSGVSLHINDTGQIDFYVYILLINILPQLYFILLLYCVNK